MALIVLPNPALVAPALRGLLEIDLATTLHLSSEDDPTHDWQATPFGTTVFEAGIVGQAGGQDQPAVTLGSPTDFGGLQQQEDLQIVLSNADGQFDQVFSSEYRGASVRWSIFEKSTGEFQQNYFVGKLSAFNEKLRQIAAVATSLDHSLLLKKVPVDRVTRTNFPDFPLATAPLEVVDEGKVFCVGSGIGRGVPTRLVKSGRTTGPQQYDYLLPVGNLGIDRMSLNGIAQPDLTGVQIIPKYTFINGRYVGALRFAGGQEGPVTVDVQRIYPDIDDHMVLALHWRQGFADLFGHDAVPGTTAGPTSTLTFAGLRTAQTGLDLGAVEFNGTSDYAQIPITTGQTFTLDFWMFPIGFTAREVIVGPGVNRGTGAKGWYVSHDPATGMVFHWDDGAARSTPATAPAPRRAWTHVRVTAEMGVGSRTVVVSINGVPAATSTLTNAIVYDGGGQPMYLGITHNAATYWRGRLGAVHLWDHACTAREAKRSYLLGKRSPIEFLREFLTFELGETPDGASFDTASDDVDVLGVGGFKCDGYITDEATAQTVIDTLVPFGDISLRRLADNTLSAWIAKPATQVQAQFGHGAGDQWANIIEFVERTKTPLADAIKTYWFAYRQKRATDTGTGGTGPQGDWQFVFPHDCLPVGNVADPVFNPFVYEHITADAMGERRAKRIVARDEHLTLRLGHEARKLLPGHVIRLDLPEHGI